MILRDVNVLVHAFRADARGHAVYREWLDGRLASPEPVGVSEIVLSGVVRIATRPRVFARPSPVKEAMGFADALRA